MVNYHDPTTIAKQSQVLMHLWHVFDGIFIWEYFTALDYEWDVIRGKRPYRWTIWVYSMARLSTLLAVILDLIGLDTRTRINCQAWATFSIIFAYGAYFNSSLLIVLRVIAVWNKEKIAITTALCIWVTEVAFLLNAIARFRSTWSPEATACLLISGNGTKMASIAILVTDIGLLLMMLVGLFRMRLKTGGAFGLGHILWKQGLIWILIVTVAEVPPAVLMILDLNAPLNQIFQNPCMIIVTIAATRMYRSLVNFDSSKMSNNTPVGSGRVASEMRVRSSTANTGPTSLNRMEVSVHTERDQSSTSKFSCQEGYKSHEVNRGVDVESTLESTSGSDK